MLREGLKADLRFDEDDALFRVERRGWPKNYQAARWLLRVRARAAHGAPRTGRARRAPRSPTRARAGARQQDKLPKSCRLVKARARHGGEGMAVPDRARPTIVGGCQVYPHFAGRIVRVPESVAVFSAFVVEEVQTMIGAISRVGTL